MPRLYLSLALALLLNVCATAQTRVYDYKNLSQQDIAELKAAHHEFYRAEAAGMQQAIRDRLALKDALVDGNQADFDVRYYGLNIRLDFTTSSISGRVDYLIRSTVASLNSVDLNLHQQLSVDSVIFGGTAAAFSHVGGLVHITTPTAYALNQQFGMSVYYHGVPFLDMDGRGMFFGNVTGYQMCYTMCSPFGARNWWPCKDYPLDKPDSVDIYVDYPTGYKVASNGLAMSDDADGLGRSQIHYKHHYPIATYLVCIACADFVYGEQTWNYASHSMPLVTYTLPNAPESKAAFETWLPEVLTHLSNKLGPYPFIDEKGGSANFGWGGAMEHQTCVFYLPTFYDSWVIAHENGHQWFGDMISASTFNHIWLKEGFASYSEALFFESYDSSLTSYLNYMQTQKFLGPGTVYVENLQTDDIFDPNLTYDKASWVVHMLRGVLGDTTFFRVLRDYYDSPYKYNSLTTEQFSAFVSSRVGTDLSWYFNQWIYGNGHPDYRVSWQCETDPAGGYNLYYFVWQTQTGGTLFRMPMRTQFVTTAGSRDSIIWNEGAEQLYTLHFADSVTNIVVDPQEWILRTVQQVPFGMRMVTIVPPEGKVGKPYSWTLHAAGGTPPYTWSQIGGDLPYGLSFGSDGIMSGTPSYEATFYYTLEVTDSSIPPLEQDRDFVHSVITPLLIGDANGDHAVDISDAVYLIGYIFSGYAPPNPVAVGDADCSGYIDISDVVFLIAYIFSAGPPPGCP